MDRAAALFGFRSRDALKSYLKRRGVTYYQDGKICSVDVADLILALRGGKRIVKPQTPPTSPSSALRGARLLMQKGK